MSVQTVRFRFRPGVAAAPFSGAALWGSWDAAGQRAAAWSTTPLRPEPDPLGGTAYVAEVDLSAEAGTRFDWGVTVDGPAGAGRWAVAAEVDDEASTSRTRAFTLAADRPEQVYALTLATRLGARKLARPGQTPGIRFAVWAPNAREVALVLADPRMGYVDDRGGGGDAPIPMARENDGVWSVATGAHPDLGDFAALVGRPYMVRIVKDDGSVAYRTDLWSLMQIGAGDVDPGGQPYAGPPEALDGPQSCSVVCDPDVVVLPGGETVAADAFWADEFDTDHPVPTRIEDLVIYELHVGALGFGRDAVGTLDDAVGFVDHLVSLGINAVELMPIAQFSGPANWGYGTSHFFAMDQAAGGTDRLKIFVKACHRRGIAVILDVCYNHFDPDSERAEWAYDSNDPTRNMWLWYEGQPSDYADPSGGYIDNVSSGWAPRFHEETVRQLFVSSAAHLALVCHVDGFRLDQTSSIHQYPALHSDGRPAGRAAAFGVKFLKQWTRTMRLLKPGLFLSAEDYSDWSALTQPSLDGDGLGFDATWYGDFHHNLIEYQDGGQAQLIKRAGFGGDGPLALSSFAGALRTSGNAKVVYNESHDDCGNRAGSARTMVTAVNGAALVGETRRWAEARVRFAAGLTLLSAGTPMFFMGEEVGAAQPYRYDDFAAHREDILGLAQRTGAQLFGFYRDLIALSIDHPAIRSRNIAVLEANDANRVIAFHRWDDAGAFVVVGSLANTPFAGGYWIHGAALGNAGWTEVFNSDGARYGGWNTGNAGQTIRAENGALNVVLPQSGFVVLRRA